MATRGRSYMGMARGTWARRGRGVLLGALLGAASGCEAGQIAGTKDSGPGGGLTLPRDASASELDARTALPGDAANSGMPDAFVENTDAALSHTQDASQAAQDAGRTFSTDRTQFFGDPRCAGAGVLLCDDFESATLDGPPNAAVWQLGGWGSGSAEVSDAHAARGTRSVHFHNPPGPTALFMTQTQTFPAAGNRIFGRMFLYVATLPEPFKWDDTANYPLVHWTAAAATGSYLQDSTTYHPEVRAIGGINQRLLINLDGGPDDEVGRDDEPPTGHEALREGEWMCFEFEYAGEGEGAELRVWWDGVEHEHLHLVNTSAGGETLWPIPKYESLSFGWAHYQDYTSILPSGFDVWIDEVAVDDERIGCQL